MDLPLIMSPATIDKLEVVSVAAALNLHPDLAFAKCFRFWGMVHQSKDGILQGVTKAHIDGALGLPGFCASLISVHWLAERPDGTLYVPGFDRYLSQKAIRSRIRQLGKPDKEAVEVIPAELQTPAFLEAWKNWKAYRKDARRPITPMTAKAQLDKCSEWGPEKAVVSIELSILNGWRGLFEPMDFQPSPKPAGQSETDKRILQQRQQAERERSERAAPPPNWRK